MIADFSSIQAFTHSIIPLVSYSELMTIE